VVVAWVNRVRRRVRLLAFFGLGLALLSVAGGGALVERETGPDDSYSLECLPFSPPDDVTALNHLIAHYRSLPGFVGADVGADVLLQDHRRLWVFGDTLRQKNFKGQQFVRNSMLIFSPGCVTVVMPANRGAVVPDRSDGVGYWPMDVGVVHHTGHDVIGVSLQRVRATGSGAFDFEVLGPAIALFDVPVGKAPELLLVRDLGPDDADPRRPMWGAAIETTADLVYIYGTALPGDGSTFGRSLQVARAPIDLVSNQSLWRYWDGRRWQRDAARAAVLVPAAGGVSQVLSVFQRDGSWYAVSKRDDILGKDLVIWKAPAPTGPFVASAPLAEIPSDSADGLLRYMPLAHPDLLPRDDSVVVSYSRNVADLERLAEHPTLYRPEFLRVPLP
jgi:hypothetical protein